MSDELQGQEPPQPTSAAGCVIRLFWAILGPGLLLALGFILILSRPRIGSALDIAFLICAALVITARACDRAQPSPAASSRDIAATSKRNYIIGVAAVTALVLVIAHVVAPRLSS